MGLEEFILGVSSSGMNFLPDVINAISIIVHGGDYVMVYWYWYYLDDE